MEKAVECKMMLNVINDDDGNDDDGNGDDDEDDGRNVERLGDSRRLQRHQLTFWALVPQPCSFNSYFCI